MHFDLADLHQPATDLLCLEEPFTHEEINVVIAALPNNTSPRPDGFNRDFLNKCWPIIKQDFYDLCDAFYQGEVFIRSINGSLVTLVPKIKSPETVRDFRPIPLLNSSIKLLTKLLANRLLTKIMQLILPINMVLSILDQFKIVKHGPLNICICVTRARKRS